MQGKIDRAGNVTLRFNMMGDKLYSPDGSQHCLPCELCGLPQWAHLLTVSVVCQQCANACPELDCNSHAHSSIDGRCEC